MPSLYSKVARAWAAVFFAVGLLFLVVPGRVGEALTALASALGLTGTIAAAGGTLWWVLSLSLMMTITVLACVSARRPTDPALYVALMVAKLVSTAGFAGLALALGSAWWLCALGDGFVAATLWLARRTVRVPVLPPGFARLYPTPAPHHEEYFGMVDLAPGRALWFRYTLLEGARREAAVWAIFFDGDRVAQQKTVRPLEDLAPGNAPLLPIVPDESRFRGRPQVFHVPGAYLDLSNAFGVAGELAWDLRLEATADRRFSHVPRLARAAGLARSSYHCVHADARAHGCLRAGDEEIVFEGATAMLGHLEGSRMALAWTWAHCNAFDEAPGVAFDGVSAFVSAAGARLGPLSSFVLFTREREYRFSSLLRIAAARSRFGEGVWTFETSAGGVTLRGEARLPTQHALLEYEDTDGSPLWCRNSRLSSLELRLHDPAAGSERVFRATRTAGFELVSRERP